MADPREHAFRDEVVEALEARGWARGEASVYDVERALFPDDVLAFVQEAHPDAWEKLQRHYGEQGEKRLLENLTKQVERHGTLDILRHGFKDRGARVGLCQFPPDHEMNPDASARYRANRLRVVPEVSYSPYPRQGEYNPRLDLVLFVNGLPVATMELKSSFQQSITQAIRQYRHDRPPTAPTTRKAEPLLQPKRGALVHFAVSQHEVWMTTQLEGDATTFLPFNKGTLEGASGNPPNPDGHATAYLWEEALAPENWLRILGRYIHVETNDKQDARGRRYTKETLIFPRYHQWDAVRKLITATEEEGPGHRYLIQHSAGSGKSNTIAWTAHQLAQLYRDDGAKMFRSVLVVTDRTVLDSQMQNTIRQVDHASGVVEHISREDGGGSKSRQLAEALNRGTRIIVVTVQTFPALLEAINERPDMAGSSFAVLADEAHSSQTGSTTRKLRQVLDSSQLPEDEGEMTGEDILDATVAARGPSDRISYYAFTATPKGKTIQIFGRPPEPSQPLDDDNKPEPFHVYSMRQAIEEGFIIDVLENYITYNVAWRLAHYGSEQEVDARKASGQIAKWVKLHPYNINQKVQIIVEHFRNHVGHLLSGHAKAMVVTGSRKEAVRYKLALDEYIHEQGYADVRPLVAFSGEVEADEVIPESVMETSRRLNPNLRGRDMREAFDTDDYNVMVVANKFQTGFDQPKLCAMYVDRALKDVDCVQTLSRLNRPYPGKRTFILDFINDPENVQAAFEPFYKTTQLANVSDPNQIYEIQNKVDEEGIYRWEEVRAFAKAFFDPSAKQHQLTKHCQPAVDRFRARYRAALEAQQSWSDALEEPKRRGDDNEVNRIEHERKHAGQDKNRLERFRRNLGSFVRFYEFISQIVPYEDRELEQLAVFARYLQPLLSDARIEDGKIDLSDLELTHYRISKQQEHRLRLGEDEEHTTVKAPGPGEGEPRDPEKEELSQIVERLNEMFGADTTEQDKISWFHSVKDKVRENERVMEQVRHNDPDRVLRGDFPRAVEDAVLDSMQGHNHLAQEVLDDDQTRRKFARMLLNQLLRDDSRSDEETARS